MTTRVSHVTQKGSKTSAKVKGRVDASETKAVRQAAAASGRKATARKVPASAQEASGREASAQEASAQEASGREASAQEASAQEASGREVPGSGVAFSAVLKDVLGSVPESERKGFMLSVVGGDDSDGLDPALWGRDPSAAERKEAALLNLRRQYETRRTVIAASLTRPEAAELLDISEQAVLDRLEAGDLVGLKKGREWRLPAWQFSSDAERGFVPGLALLRRVFPGGVVSLTEWATAPNADLDGSTPVRELAVGRVDEVVRAAGVGTSAAW